MYTTKQKQERGNRHHKGNKKLFKIYSNKKNAAF